MDRLKLIGITGTVLYLLSYLPSLSYIFVVIGSVVLLYVFWEMSKMFKNDKIFMNFLLGTIFQMAAVGLMYFKLFAVFAAVFIGAFSNNPIIPITSTIVIYFIAYYIINIIGAYFIKESFVAIRQHTNVALFEYAGILIILGAVLKIIAVGFFIEIGGWILLIVAFLSLAEQKDLPKLEHKKNLIEYKGD